MSLWLRLLTSTALTTVWSLARIAGGLESLEWLLLSSAVPLVPVARDHTGEAGLSYRAPQRLGTLVTQPAVTFLVRGALLAPLALNNAGLEDGMMPPNDSALV